MAMIKVSKIIEICNPMECRPWDSEYKGYKKKILHYVRNGWSDPIQIDVGIPYLLFCPSWIVTDGNHRLSAAIIRGDEYIEAEISGDRSYASELFDLKYGDL